MYAASPSLTIASGCQGFFAADAKPIVSRIFFADVREIGLSSIAHIEEISEHLHFVALLTFSEQRRNGNFEMLPQEIQERRFDRGTSVNRDPQIECLQTAPAGVPICKRAANGAKYLVIPANALPDKKRLCIFERGPDAFTSGHLAYAYMSRAVFQDQNIAGEERTVCSAQIEKHAIRAGNRNDGYLLDPRRAGKMMETRSSEQKA